MTELFFLTETEEMEKLKEEKSEKYKSRTCFWLCMVGLSDSKKMVAKINKIKKRNPDVVSGVFVFVFVFLLIYC